MDKRQNKGAKGFTLVEVIVTAVIVAVLAAVAVPVYLQYVTDQKQTTVDNLAATGAGSASSYFRRTGSHPDSAKLNLFLSNPNEFKVSVQGGSTKTVTVQYAEDASISSTVGY